ncbi:MAG: hypothetical protein K0U86_19335 [Planctomycetes bacterium]|nr:hypothetical protein [Planctomycetota bacterium]MCH9727061.1 hypothetical protein [Planctomycetota bacterium]MCH9775004.1 hypothetical protein [Planctomycetota bacterium]MCH9792277.1 hypothetical protein [Planctomycetota bacterium]MDF1745169.1 hypothetical protein [Gimesia sp.]
MRTVLEVSLLFTLAIVSVSYAIVRDELLELKLQCHLYGYAKITVNELGTVQSIKLNAPSELGLAPKSDRNQKPLIAIEQKQNAYIDYGTLAEGN